MHAKKALLAATLTVATCGTAFSFAQRPAQGVNPGRHPNIAAAQRLTAQAFQRIQDAQRANEWDMGGHAQRAKDLLDQANRELGMAAAAANAH